MENTTIRRAAQLIQDLRTLNVLNIEDQVKVFFVPGLEEIIVRIVFSDISITENHGIYKIVVCAFKKEFKEDLSMSDYISSVENNNLVEFEINM